MPQVTATVTVTSKTGGSQQVTASCLVGAAGLVGATVDPKGYGLTDYAAAAQLYNTYTGTTAATSIQKFYLQEGKFFTAANIPAGITALAKLGCQILLCVKPSRSGVVAGGTPNATGQQQITAMQGCLAALAGAGVRTYGVIPFQECNLQDHSTRPPAPFFPSPQAYWDYLAVFGPAVLDAGLPLIYDPALNTERFAEAFSFLPANGGLFAELVVDFYADGSGWRGGIRLDSAWNGIGPAGGIMSVADDLGWKFGLGEWGNSSTGTAQPMTVFTPYVSHVQGALWGRLQAGRENGPAVYYSGSNASGGNIVTGPTDPKCGPIGALYNGTSLQVLGS